MKDFSARRATLLSLALVTSVSLLLGGATAAQAAGDASISGTVVDSTGAPLGGIDVLAYAYGSPWNPAATGQTNSDGTYTISGLNASGYFVKFMDTHTGPERGASWWHDHPSLAYGGDLIDLALAPTRSGIDQAMYFSSQVSVSVTCAKCIRGQSVFIDTGAAFEARAPGSDVWSDIQEAFPTPNDTYSFQASQPGDYRIRVGYSGTEEYLDHSSASVTFTESVPQTLPTIALSRARILARTSGGTLYRDSFAGGTKLAGKVKIGTGFSSYAAVFDAGDFTGDGLPDVMGITSTGSVSVYPGTVSGGLSGRLSLGKVLAGLRDFASAGDWDGDGNVDVFARSASGTLYFVPGDGRGGFLPKVAIGKSGAWKSYNLFRYAAGFGTSGRSSLLARNSDGSLYLFHGDYDDAGLRIFKPRVRVSSGLASAKSIIVSTDLNADSYPDLIVRTSGGSLVAYLGKTGGAIRSKKTISSGWKSYSVVS